MGDGSNAITPFFCLFYRRQTLIALKEKSQKSRTPSANNSPVSIKSNKRIIPESISDEELHEEVIEEKPPHIRKSVERLDTQVSTLHQDVATLSIEVRNAIQALQEMTYTTFTHMDHPHVPARSIPNLQNGIAGAHIAQEFLTRSSSQPAEIWHRSNPHIKSFSDLLGWELCWLAKSSLILTFCHLQGFESIILAHCNTQVASNADRLDVRLWVFRELG